MEHIRDVPVVSIQKGGHGGVRLECTESISLQTEISMNQASFPV